MCDGQVRTSGLGTGPRRSRSAWADRNVVFRSRGHGRGLPVRSRARVTCLRAAFRRAASPSSSLQRSGRLERLRFGALGVMVEPFLVSLHTILSTSATLSRSLLALPATMHPVLQQLASQDAVSMHFKRLKGKQKALPEYDWMQHSGWICEPHGGTAVCTIHHRYHTKEPPPRRQDIPGILKPPSHSSHRGLLKSPVTHARHASTRSMVCQKVVREDALGIVRAFIHGRPPDSQNHPVSLDLAWDKFMELRTGRLVNRPRPGMVVPFVDRVVTVLEESFTQKEDLKEWVERLQQQLTDVDPLVKAQSPQDVHRLCVWTRIHALRGDIAKATSTFAQMNEVRYAVEAFERHPTPAELRTYETMFHVLSQTGGPVVVLDFIIEYWRNVGQSVYDPRFHNNKGVNRAVDSVTEAAFRVLDNIELPAGLLASRKDQADRVSRALMTELLIVHLIARRAPEAALDVWKEMDRQGLQIPFPLELSLVRALVRGKAFGLANILYSTLASNPKAEHDRKTFLAVGLHLFAQQGDVARAEEHFAELTKMQRVGPADVGMLLQAHALQGDTATVVRLFHKHFPADRRTYGYPYGYQQPTIRHYTPIIMAHAKARDIDGLNRWLETMAKEGHAPDRHVFDIIVQNFAARGEIDAVAMVLDKMRLAGMPPLAVTYTNIIIMLAGRLDPVAAEAIYKRALHEGVQPDRQMVAALMTAHAEAGSWRGVIRAFDFIKTSSNRQLRPRIDVYNILLKAYVLVGAPFPVVAEIYQKIEDADVRPTTHTFSLLIQSACDSGLMDVATGVFRELDELSRQWETGLSVSAYALTIIMAGYLRLGNKYKAKEVYDDMLARGIQPTSVTYGHILKAYTNEGSQESLLLAKDFLKSLMKEDSADRTWLDPSYRRLSGFEHIYGPLMTFNSRTAQPEELEKQFQEVLDAGGQPSIFTLALLLNAYRNVGHIEAVREIWSHIVELGQQLSNVEPLFEGSTASPREDIQRKANILCVPFSIYMDAISTAGFHDEVAEVWNTLRRLGFAFDSHNWNHLVVVLVRAGKPLHAFQILEKVIIPYQEQSHRVIAEREQSPSSPFAFDDIVPLEEVDPDEVEAAPPVMNYTAARRAEAVGLADRNVGNRLRLPADRPDDFAHPLHILHQMSPSWNVWRPHATVVKLLSSVLDHLQEGRMVQPLRPADTGRGPPEDEDEDEDEAATARRTLREISDSCPNAVAVVKDYSYRLRSSQQLEEMVDED